MVLRIEGEHGEDSDSGHNLEIELRDRCLLNSEQLVWIRKKSYLPVNSTILTLYKIILGRIL